MPFDLRDLDIDRLANEVSRRMVRSAQRVPFQSARNQTATDASGGTKHLDVLWQHPDRDSIVLVTIALAPTSSAGVWRSDGPSIQSDTDGLFLAAGGGYLYLTSAEEARDFRMRAVAAGTITFSWQAYRTGQL